MTSRHRASAAADPTRQVVVVLGEAPTNLLDSLRAAGLTLVAEVGGTGFWEPRPQLRNSPAAVDMAVPAPVATSPTAPLLMTIADAALALGLGRSTVYQLIGRGELEVVHVGRSARVPADALHCLVERAPNGPGTIIGVGD